MATTSNPAFIFLNPTIELFVGVGPGSDYRCELTRAELTNDVAMVDTGSLCGAAQKPGRITWNLELEGYQGYEDTTLWRFLWDNQREEAQFRLLPKDEAAGAGNPEVTGTVVCVPGTLGGTREEAATFSVTLPLVGDPVLDDTGGVMAASASSSSSE